MLKRDTVKKTRKKKRGQSTVEYIILVAAVLGALIVFLRPDGVFYNAFNRTLNTGTQGMDAMAEKLATSRVACNVDTGEDCVPIQ